MFCELKCDIGILESGVQQIEISYRLKVAQNVMSRMCFRFYQTDSTSVTPKNGY